MNEHVHRLTIPAETQAEIVALYRRGLTYKQIADRVFWSATAVRRTLILNGVTPRRNNAGRQQLTTDEALQRAQLYGLGCSLAEVADICGCSVTAVALTLKRQGVPTRSPSEGLRRAYLRGRRSGFARGRSELQEAR